MMRLLLAGALLLVSYLVNLHARATLRLWEEGRELKWSLMTDPTAFRQKYCGLPDGLCRWEVEWHSEAGNWNPICEGGNEVEGIGRYWKFTNSCPLVIGQYEVLEIHWSQVVFR